MTANYKIEKGVPVPPKRRLMGEKFPFTNMEIGDSFEFNSDMKPQTVGYLAAIFAREQEPQWKFIVRKTTAGYRCWRIK